MEKQTKKVLVALSGGVDSSVAAALLVEQGYQVIGATMRLWSAPGCDQENRCCTPETRSLASELADKLSIPFIVLDETETFRKIVVQQFLDGYARGETPN
ncbi:MAG: tRNA 2-thiouridine(34) synthase MnmA, partial [Chloroflexi bacterium]|nr:tRNA 2-thiouridine(34) synthase MnmA [Chloroflexota bacterium]